MNIIKKINLVTIFQGFIMGMAEIIPGVSGSTMALIMGIYDDFLFFLDQISNVVKTFLKVILKRSNLAELKSSFLRINFSFGILLGFGMVLALLVLSNLITILLHDYTQYVFAFFFGLVLISIKIPFQQMNQRTWKELVIFILSFIAAFIILGLRPVELSQSPTLLYISLGGALAICAMVLPGVSGSFIFLILGLYEYIIDQIKLLTHLEISMEGMVSLFVLALGILVGFTTFVKVLKIAYKKYASFLMAFLIGLMLGSLRVVWPFIVYSSDQSPALMPKVMPWEIPTSESILILVLAVIAVVFVILLEKFSKRYSPYANN